MKFSTNKFDYTAYAYYDVSGLSIEEQSVINDEITGRLTLMLHQLIDQPLSSSDEVNMIYSGLNASRFRFGIIMSILISSTLSFICAVLYDTYKLKYMMSMKVPAKLKSKFIRNQTNFRSALISTVFELNFELENNEIKQFTVTPEQFFLVFENNKGVLTYKEHSKSIFLDFEVLDING